MNGKHFRAFLWLRWRLRVNQFRKAGTLSTVLFFVFVVLVLIAAVGFAVAGFLVGFFALPDAKPPVVRLLVWDGVIAAFLFFWMIGLLSDLQRSEGLALDKVMHLPVSPSGAFAINYLSSLVSLTLIAFLPGMVGLILGQVFAGSASMLLALPLLAAFVLAVTGVTYQFQGWLASLMSNPRRRRTVVVFVTLGVILITQLPNMVNMARPWERGSDPMEPVRQSKQLASDQADVAMKKITPEEYERRVKETAAKQEERSQQMLAQTEQIARLISSVLPPGWLALGAADLASGSPLPALLGTLGFGLIGAVSLWRAYRTTIRLYTGQFTGPSPRRTVRPQSPADPNKVRMLEWRLPWVPEPASAVALAAFRSLVRAPEAKMALVAPLIVFIMIGGSMLSTKVQPPAEARPFLALGAAAMVVLLSGVQLIGNQFGYDRAGFRAYVLSPAPRRSILLGKNLATAPLGIGLGLAVLLLVGTAFPMRVDYYPAVAMQLVSVYLLFCLLANALSILAPMPMAAGSMQPRQIKMGPALLQVAFMAVLPVILVPTFIPFGIELLLVESAGIRGVPVAAHPVAALPDGHGVALPPGPDLGGRVAGNSRAGDTGNSDEQGRMKSARVSTLCYDGDPSGFIKAHHPMYLRP